MKRSFKVFTALLFAFGGLSFSTVFPDATALAQGPLVLTPLGQDVVNAEQNAIRRLLTRQTEAWNQGNLELFMRPYWRSEALTFSSGGTTTRGWQATLKRYRTNYAPPREMGRLTFGELEITLIESKTAMVLGKWELTNLDQTQRGGNFTLVLHKLDNNWRIIHDHSSILTPQTKDP